MSSQADRHAADGDNTTVRVVLAADRLSGARRAFTTANDADRRASDANISVHVLEDNAEETQESRDAGGVRFLDGVAALDGAGVA